MITFISIGGEGSHVAMKQNEKDRKESAKIKERITKREKRGRMRAQNWTVKGKGRKYDKCLSRRRAGQKERESYGCGRSEGQRKTK